MCDKFRFRYGCTPKRKPKCRPRPECKPKCKPKPKCERKPIAAEEYGYMTGDPHFKGGDGGFFDVDKPGTYNILKDMKNRKGVNYKAKIDYVDEWGNTGVCNSQIVVKDKSAKSSINYDKDGNAKLITVSREHGKTETIIERGKTYQLPDGGSVCWGQALGGGTDGQSMEERLIIKTREYTITQVSRDGKYIDSNVETGEKGVYADRKMPSGLIGDTFDRDDKKRTSVDDLSKYETEFKEIKGRKNIFSNQEVRNFFNRTSRNPFENFYRRNRDDD